MNDRGCSIRVGTEFTIIVLHSNTLVWLNSFKFNDRDCLSIEFTETHGGPEARTPADGGGRRALSGGITAEVDVSEISTITLIVETVRELRFMIKRIHVELVLITRFRSDNTSTF